uniref:Uncharacterized protein n=1 Tax=Siphoviridae sp. ctkkB9 TaxID=2825644 RepID=A0A8S5TZI7_9CAUD|nr:MAG TPA: hypothetical protein [Siphoviridae sp. ctkkB9]
MMTVAFCLYEGSDLIWEFYLEYSRQEISPKTEPQAVSTPFIWVVQLRAKM